MVLQPVGPLPAGTYWRRRLLLVGAVVVLLLVLRACAGGGGHVARVTAVTSPSPTPGATVSAAPARTATPAPAARTPAPSPAAAVVGPCPDSALQVTVRTDTTDYPKGSSPRFTVTVSNASAVSCRRDLGTGAVELVVSSGADRIWSSADCGGAAGSEVLTLKPGASLQKTVTWYGKRSARGCPSPAAQPQAAPGYYRVVARVGTLRSAAAVFRIH